MVDWHKLNRSINLKFLKPVPSLLPNVDLSTKKMQVFIINARSISNMSIHGAYYVLKKLLVKTIIVCSSIYFEP